MLIYFIYYNIILINAYWVSFIIGTTDVMKGKKSSLQSCNVLAGGNTVIKTKTLSKIKNQVIRILTMF